MIKTSKTIYIVTCQEFVEKHILDSSWRDDSMISEFERETSAVELLFSPLYSVDESFVDFVGGVWVSEEGEHYSFKDLEINGSVPYICHVEV